MGSATVVTADPVSNAGHGLAAAIGRIEIDAFIFQAAPQPFDKHIVHPAHLAVRGDPDAASAGGTKTAGAASQTGRCHASGNLKTRYRKSGDFYFVTTGEF